MKDFYQQKKFYNPYEELRRPNKIIKSYDVLARGNYSPDTKFMGVVIPYYDDWKPRVTNSKYFPVTALISVELEDPTFVVNLLELGDVTLSQTIVNYIFRNRVTVVKNLHDVF